MRSATKPNRIAVLIPCFNEEITIGKVVEDFRKELPEAEIYVYDNNSTDETVSVAKSAGAIVKFENMQGKGHVVQAMFREIEADYYVMVDGDDTYPATHVLELLKPVMEGRCHMCVGTRLDTFTSNSFRSMHQFGNEMIRKMINFLFQAKLRDVLSGYRCYDSFFVKTVPLLSGGFEIEVEQTLQALDKRLSILETPIPYRNRPAGSVSKLNTYLDGVLVVKTIFRVFKDYRPLLFFSIVSALSLLIGFALGAIPVIEFLETHIVRHVPTAILAMGLVLVALLALATGFILDTMNRRHLEQFQVMKNLISMLNNRN